MRPPPLHHHRPHVVPAHLKQPLLGVRHKAALGPLWVLHTREYLLRLAQHAPRLLLAPAHEPPLVEEVAEVAVGQLPVVKRGAADRPFLLAAHRPAPLAVAGTSVVHRVAPLLADLLQPPLLVDPPQFEGRHRGPRFRDVACPMQQRPPAHRFDKG